MQPLNIKSQWFSGVPATLTSLPGDATRIEVWPPTDFSWTPGQHTFLRFPSFAPLENHPFTIVSAPNSGSVREKDNLDSHSSPPLVFVARAYDGFTRKLAFQAGKVGPDTTTSVWLDGPYGGIKRQIEQLYDTLLLVAGGTGITACLPWLLNVIAKAKASKTGFGAIETKRLILVWTIRSTKSLSWVEEELMSLRGLSDLGVKITCNFHITGSCVNLSNDTTSQETPLPESKEDLEVGIASDSGQGNEAEDSEFTYSRRLVSLGTCTSGRPIMTEVVNNFVADGEKVMVIGCGPETFMTDLSNAVASAQKRAFTGNCKKIVLHSETFSW
jgi:NAD(P)H-flavin reductase